MPVLERFGDRRAAAARGAVHRGDVIAGRIRTVGEQRFAVALARLRQRNAVLRATRAGDARDDVLEVQLDGVGEARRLRVLVVPEPLRVRIGLDELDLLARATCELEVAERLLVDREDRHRRAELRRHVADRRSVGDRQVGEAVAEELDEASDDALRAQQLRDRENEVGRRRALAHRAVEAEADHLGDEHRHRLAEHRRLGFDPADAPAEHAETVDHRRVRVGADERVRVGARQPVAGVVDEHDAREVLEVDLVADAGVGRDDGEVVERVLAPAQERVALDVALELALGIAGERVATAEHVDLDRVVDDQLGRDQRVDPLRVAAELGDRVAHRGEVDDAGDAGEVLHQDARRGEGDLVARLGGGVPVGQPLDVLRADGAVSLGPQQVLEQDLQRVGQPGDVEALGERVEAVDLEAALADLEFGPGGEAIGWHARPPRLVG